MGWAERSWRWGRRNPTAAALVATALALVGLAVGGGFWLERQQAERREETARREGRQSKAAEAVLEQAAALQKQGRWPEARAVLEGAPSLVDTPALADLRQRVGQALADARMVTELEEIRLRLLEGRAALGASTVCRGLPGVRDRPAGAGAGGGGGANPQLGHPRDAAGVPPRLAVLLGIGCGQGPVAGRAGPGGRR